MRLLTLREVLLFWRSFMENSKIVKNCMYAQGGQLIKLIMNNYSLKQWWLAVDI